MLVSLASYFCVRKKQRIYTIHTIYIIYIYIIIYSILPI
nr:MAG TPA: hypothetical protein [Caudoviricetes sp.]